MRLDTPLKRTGALVAMLGIVVLGSSLLLWMNESRRHRIYYSQNVYDWVPVAEPSLPLTTATDTLWTFDANCLQPHRQARTGYFGYATSQREGAAIETAAMLDTSALARALGNGDAKDTRTIQDKAADGLAFVAGLQSMPREQAMAVLRECSTTTGVVFQKVRTDHHTDLPQWSRDHAWPFWIGASLVAVGLLASVLYGATIGPIWRWVRKG